tara:strand:+ start:10266 stop:11258 length:993 start_codon:yes stop_codon:yes gene_type:complete
MSRFYYSVFGPYIVQFIDFKNSLGYKYKRAGWALSMLDRMALEKDAPRPVVTKELADQYCLKRPNETGKTRSNRVCILAQFARFLNDLGLEPSNIPKCPPAKNRYTPYIFSQEQVQAIFKASDGLFPSRNRNSSIYAVPALVRLLYATGLRVGEAIALKHSDVDLHFKCLILRETKNGEDRIVPISDTLAKVCGEYVEYRNLVPSTKRADRFFIKPDGSAISVDNVYRWFRKILYKAGIPYGGRSMGPRLHDMRHTFSVHSLACMARSGSDLYCSLPVLSTYLGHKSLRGTNIYVRLTAEMYPDLIKKASLVCAGVFPVTNTKKEDHETD